MKRLATWPTGLWLIVILLLAAVLRFSGLEQLPPGLYHDEAYNGLDALSLLRGATFPQFYEGWELYAAEAHPAGPPQPTRWPIFFEGNYGREPLHIYLMALSIKLLGAQPLAIRAVPAAAGVLAVATTCAAAWALWEGRVSAEARRRRALYTAFFLAILVPAIHFSRFGLRGMLMVAPETLAVTCFLRGLRQSETHPPNRGRLGMTGWWVLAGFFTGLGFYTFAAARLFPLVLAAYVGLWQIQEHASYRRWGWPFIALTLTALATAAPLLLYFMRTPYFFTFRLAYVANRGKGTVPGKPVLTWLLNIGRTVAGLFWYGETHLRHNLVGRPYLDGIQSFLCLSGLGYSLRHWRDRRAQFLLIWLGVMLLPTILSGDAPHFGRLVGVAPAVAAALGLGLERWQAWLTAQAVAWTPGRRWGLSRGAPALALGLSLFLSVDAYFVRYAQQPALAVDFYQPDWELGQAAAGLSADTWLYLTPPQAEMATIYFALGGQTERLHSYTGDAGLTPSGPPGAPAAYFIRPEAESTLAHLQQLYPLSGLSGGDGYRLLYVAAVPALTTERQVNLSFNEAVQLAGWSASTGDSSLTVDLVWQATGPIDQNYTAFVHLLDGSGRLIAQNDRPPAGYPTADWRPGEIIRDSYPLILPADLPPGDYTLEAGFYAWPSLTAFGRNLTLGVWSKTH